MNLYKLYYIFIFLLITNNYLIKTVYRKREFKNIHTRERAIKCVWFGKLLLIASVKE